jgi:hypothetical protein
MSPNPTTGLDEAVERVRRNIASPMLCEGNDWAVCHIPDLTLILSALDTLEAECEQAQSNEDNLRAEAKFWGADADKWQARAERAEAALSDCMVALRPFAEQFVMGDAYVQFAPRLIRQARETYARLAASPLSRVEGEGVLQPAAFACASPRKGDLDEAERPA